MGKETKTNRKFHVSEMAINERASYGGPHNERGLIPKHRFIGVVTQKQKPILN